MSGWFNFLACDLNSVRITTFILPFELFISLWNLNTAKIKQLSNHRYHNINRDMVILQFQSDYRQPELCNLLLLCRGHWVFNPANHPFHVFLCLPRFLFRFSLFDLLLSLTGLFALQETANFHVFIWLLTFSYLLPPIPEHSWGSELRPVILNNWFQPENCGNLQLCQLLVCRNFLLVKSLHYLSCSGFTVASFAISCFRASLIFSESSWSECIGIFSNHKSESFQSFSKFPFPTYMHCLQQLSKWLSTDTFQPQLGKLHLCLELPGTLKAFSKASL